ncbi:MAG TPA: tryptophan synthase subunit beta, partial [Actinomycetota bacterium]|nr:tryptophan synthase subunit beta [Actinomycetota bacterium]
MTSPSSQSIGGYFGEFGGRFAPEALIASLEELAEEMDRAFADEDFLSELDRLNREISGRPTPLYLAERLTAHAGGARIWLKREDA